jgi:hypothetical protein
MIKKDTAGEYVGIQCDRCNIMAPPAREILDGHGLVNMGWYCSGGTHICPAHDHPTDGWPQRPELGVLKASGRGG